MDQAVPKSSKQSILENLQSYSASELRRLVTDLIARQRVGLYWERNAIERDRALNDANVLASYVPEHSCGRAPHSNLIIEGENFDALRLLRTTHLNKIRVIFIDPPYNTGKEDFAYNDRYLNKDDRDRQSTWLDWLYRRLVLCSDLLTSDGVILVCINDENRARCDLLLEAALPGRRVGSFVWKSRKSTNDVGDHNFSSDHEHVLVYAREDFIFDGLAKRNSDYTNEDPNGDKWASAPLNVSVKWDDPRAGNAFYPIHDPETDIWYPCNPDSVWRFASINRLKPGQKLKALPMETLIAEKRVAFPVDNRTVVWPTLEDMLADIDAGKAPDSQGKPLLRRELPGLEFFVGKRVGWGRPRLKRYLKDQKRDRQPVSSWVRSSSLKEKIPEQAETVSLESPYSDAGNKVIENVFGKKPFNTAKPVELIQSILRSLSREDDIILDCFAGSGTTAHAVLALNAEDEGARNFILISNTEATRKAPDKNLCRDVCAERVRSVINGYGKNDGLGGEFAYLRTTRIEAGDMPFELTSEMVWNTLCLRHAGAILPWIDGPIQAVPSEEATILICLDPDDGTLQLLSKRTDPSLIVYTDRPGAVREALSSVPALDVRDVLSAVETTSIPLESE